MPHPLRNRYRACQAAILASLLAACHPTNEAPPTAATGPAKFVTGICVNGKCAAIDQAGALRVPFDNPYDAIAAVLLEDSALVAKDNRWYLLDAKTGKLGQQAFADDVASMNPGIVAFRRQGKWGLIDAAAREVQAPRFDSIGSGGQNEFMTYRMGGKTGLLDARGKVLTPPLYDDVDTGDLASERGNLVMAQRGSEEWLLNLGDGSQKKVDYERLGRLADGHMVVEGPQAEKLQGLVDTKGDLVIPLRYEWLGNQAEGLVAFRTEAGKPCGYLDDSGKVVVPPHHDDCGAFGKKGAIASASESRGTPGFGLLGRNDKWVLPPTYDTGGRADRSLLGMTRNVPGYALIGKSSTMLLTDVGIFDTDTGRQAIPPIYRQVGVLTPDRFVFSAHGSPLLRLQLMGMANAVPAVGLMNAQQKVLAFATRYVDIEMDGSGRYLRGFDGAEPPREALLDLNGQEIVPLQWNRVVVDEGRRAIFGKLAPKRGEDAKGSLRAAYDLAGRPIFSIVTLPCGAEQLMNAAGQAVWPSSPNDYCTRPVSR